jgi:hypothetical protein
MTAADEAMADNDGGSEQQRQLWTAMVVDNNSGRCCWHVRLGGRL